MKPSERLEMVWEAALAMAPAFRDKFDFADGHLPGEKNQYQKLSDMAFTSAEALVAEYEARRAKLPAEAPFVAGSGISLNAGNAEAVK